MRVFSEYPVNVADLVDALPYAVVSHAVGIAVRHVVGVSERDHGKDATIRALASLRVEADTSRVVENYGRKMGVVTFRASMEVA